MSANLPLFVCKSQKGAYVRAFLATSPEAAKSGFIDAYGHAPEWEEPGLAHMDSERGELRIDPPLSAVYNRPVKGDYAEIWDAWLAMQSPAAEEKAEEPTTEVFFHAMRDELEEDDG